MKKLICIICPRGCPLEIDESTLEVRGNSCPRGRIYAESALTQPVRTVTTTVAIEGATIPRCPVRTTLPVPKALVGRIVRTMKGVTLRSPVHIGQIVARTVLDSGADITVCRDL